MENRKESDTMETIGNRITTYRKKKSMTQEALAEKLGVSSQAVSKWENDLSCPDISLLVPLCDILGISTDELLSGKNNEVRVLPTNERKSLEELTLRVKVNSAEGDRIRVNLPMALVKMALEIGVDVVPNMGGALMADNKFLLYPPVLLCKKAHYSIHFHSNKNPAYQYNKFPLCKRFHHSNRLL